MSTSNRVSRKKAAERLKVSIRTVDRYIKTGKLRTFEENGRKWLLESDLGRFSTEERSGQGVDKVDTIMSTKNHQDNVDNREHFLQQDLSTLSTIKRKPSISTYKKLYEQTKEELNEKQERLEIANYRVGQLENQLKNSIPLLQYHQENNQRKTIIIELEDELTKKEQLIGKISHKIKQEKLIKQIFLILLLVIMALQPLWLLAIEN